jgi:hypothetical protein
MSQQHESEEWGAAPARYSELKPGEQARYRTGTQLVSGEVLHVSDGAMGQLYIIANPLTGFPDVVPARDLIA